MLSKNAVFGKKEVNQIMKYCYLLSFTFAKNGTTSIGSAVVKINNPIKTLKDIEDVVNFLKKNNDFDEVALLNFSFLEGE